MLVTGFIITLLYVLLIGSLIRGFNKVPTYELTESTTKTTFTVIVPFRNEAENLPTLLKSIQDLKYPINLFEVILVDDDSNDDSVEVIKKVLDTSRFRRDTRTDISIIKNERKTHAPKKDAITTAIHSAKHEWIITTDADCLLPESWLNSLDDFIQQTTIKCIVGPVKYHDTNGFLNHFQSLDLLSLQGATIGGFGINRPFLCNGANFAYKKSVFNALKGFEGNTNIASGDDIFLLEKIATTYPKSVHYLKCGNTTVSTKPQKTWADLFSQRMRWAAKTSAYNTVFAKLTGLIVLLMNVLFVMALLLFLFNSF